MKNITWLSGTEIEADVKVLCIKGFSFEEVKDMINGKGYSLSINEYNSVNTLLDEELMVTLNRLNKKL